MPIRQVRGKWYWGSKGPFDSRQKAEAVARAAYSNGYREKTLVRLAVSQLLKYSEDQARDADGRWSSEGAAAASVGRLHSELTKGRLEDISPTIMGRVSAEALAAVVEIDNRPPLADDLPEKTEPDLTDETKALASNLADELLVTANSTRANVNGTVGTIADLLGGELHGLEFEVKTEQSLERKLGQAIEEDGMTPDEALADMKDVVRYTVVLSPEDFATGATSLIEQFTAKGFTPLKSAMTFGATASAKMEVKSGGSLLTGELIPGAAVNTAWEDPATGLPFEIQVHTPDSLVAKTVSHEYYDIARVMAKDDPMLRPLTEKMVDLVATVDIPPGVDTIPTYRYVP